MMPFLTAEQMQAERQLSLQVTAALDALTNADVMTLYLLATPYRPYTPVSEVMRQNVRSLHQRGIVELVGTSAAYQLTHLGQEVVYRAILIGLQTLLQENHL